MGFAENRKALETALSQRNDRRGTDKAMFLRMGQAGQLAVTNWNAPTGIGCFDASYNPNTFEYKITIRVFFEFFQPDVEDFKVIKWDQTAKDKYIRDTLKTVKDNWSGRYKIKCTREGWEELEADVVVDVVNHLQRDASHFVLVAKRRPDNGKSEGGGVSWASTPPAIDVDSKGIEPKVKQEHLQAIFNMRERQMQEAVISSKCGVIEFAHESSAIRTAENGKLTLLLNALKGIIRPDVVGLKVYVYGSTSGYTWGNRAKARADAVCNFLKQGITNGDAIFESLTKLTALQKAAALKSLQKHFDDPNRTSLSLSGCVLFVQTAKPDTVRESLTFHLVMVHEFGHVLGLPDEYTGRLHPRIADTKPLASVMPATMQKFNEMSGDKSKQWVDKGDRKALRTAAQQGGFARMYAEQGDGIDMPLFTTGEALSDDMDAFKKIYEPREAEIKRLAGLHGGYKSKQVKDYEARNPKPDFPMVLGSSSIMATGADIMPAHYLTIWSSLADCTRAFLSPSDWKIDPAPLK